MSENCNCVEHFCCGYEAGLKAANGGNQPEIILEAEEIHEIRKLKHRRYEGHYHITVYYPKRKPISIQDDWYFLLKTLVDFAGLEIDTVKFQVRDEPLDYAIGLREG